MICETDRKVAMKYGNKYSDIMIASGVDDAVKSWNDDCNNGIITPLQSGLAGALTDMYVNAKTGKITRDECKTAQNMLFAVCEVEE